MILETERLILRRWQEDDAESLYKYASDPRVGPIAGWPIHTDVEDSGRIINTILSGEYSFAICLKEDGKAIGSIGLIFGEDSNINLEKNEAEIGYWIGVPFWGKGMVPEAVKEVMALAFNELAIERLWCGYFEGNEKSKRVQEKCGFKYQYTVKDVLWAVMNDIRTEHFTSITKQEWLNDNRFNDLI